ncbi:MAG: recombinase zinc beta ribbon domain-containing protein [Faecousia sp.]
MVFCGCCDHALSYVANKQPYFRCRRSQAYETGPCHDLKIDAEELEQVIFQTVKAQLEAVLSIGADGSICLDAVAAEPTEYEKQIEALEDSKQSLFEQYVMGEIDAETYKSEKAACDAAILKAKNAYAAISAQAKKKQEEQARQSSRTEIAKAITDAERLTPELVNLLIEKVYVFPDKRIEIAYKVQDLFE